MLIEQFINPMYVYKKKKQLHFKLLINSNYRVTVINLYFD